MQQVQRRIFYILILLAGLAWIGISADTSGQAAGIGISAPQVGFVAPDFSLQTPGGEIYTLSALRGRPVLINLWATWCPPCRAEMPAIQQLYEEYRGQGLVVLAINSTIQDDPRAIPSFLEEYGLTFPVLMDVTGDVSQAYELRSLPSSFFIKRDGTINEMVIGGPMSMALLRTRIEEILK